MPATRSSSKKSVPKRTQSEKTPPKRKSKKAVKEEQKQILYPADSVCAIVAPDETDHYFLIKVSL